MKSLRGEAGRLLEFINYQDASIVSREIIKEKTGSVTLFAFDKGQALSEHTSPYDALAQVLEGEVEITISGKPSLLSEGDAIIMPANQPHALNTVRKAKLVLTMILS
jgi:quercetin dioxygenase-like cupin family protein